MYKLKIGNQIYSQVGDTSRNGRRGQKRTVTRWLTQLKPGKEEVQLFLERFGFLILHQGIDSLSIPEGTLSTWTKE